MREIINFEATNLKEKKAIDVLNMIFHEAVVSRVSDIVFDIKFGEGARVRFKRDGVYSRFLLPELVNERTGLFDWTMAAIFKEQLFSKSLIDRMSRSCQDGRMRLFYDDRQINFRVAVAPTTVHGSYYIVCRILDSINAAKSLDSLDVLPFVKRTLTRILDNPEGAFLMSGPTGSGKTTTLYSCLDYTDNGERGIVTIEHPVEYEVDGFCQMEVNGHDITWESALTSAVRLSPDVIMVGEVRDYHSAMAALQAGQTGHNLLTTIHANSASQVPNRLSGLGVPSYMIGSVVTGIAAQRLVKRIPDGAEITWVDPTEIQEQWLKKNQVWHEGMKVPRMLEGRLSGRLPIIEIIEVDAQLRELLFAGASDQEIVDAAARQPQYETLAQAGVRLVLSGKTTLEEVMDRTKDGIIVPRFKRPEQTLLESGMIKMDELHKAQDLVLERFDQGIALSLLDALLEIGVQPFVLDSRDLTKGPTPVGVSNVS